MYENKHESREPVRIISVVIILLAFSARGYGWQQRVGYDIKVSLNTKTHILEGKERLKYINNSPDTLKFIWIHLYPNAFKDRTTTFAKECELMGRYDFSFSSKKDRGYMDINQISVHNKPLKHKITGTEVKVWLPHKLVPGDSIEIHIEFFEKIPKPFSRLGRSGELYELQQWYPKPVVYDETGWHPDGYHAVGEFYGEFGNFDVYITLPKYMIVGATGVLVSPEGELKMLDSMAIQGDKLEKLKSKKKPLWKRFIPSISLLPKKSPKRPKGTKTLHFHAEQVHDFAWVASPDFKLVREEWDGITINVLYNKKHEGAWKFVGDYARDALKYYSGWYGKYPYSVLWVIDGNLGPGAGGMEYPNLVIIDANAPGFMRTLEVCVMHEVGHQWFYGVLGSNEMDETVLDEGINVFSEVRYMETKYGKERNLFKWPRPLPGFDDRWQCQMLYYITATNQSELPILTPAYKFVPNPIAYTGIEYGKAPWVIDMLRWVVGDTTFDKIMREYVKRFKYTHPHTQDFIKVTEEISGQKLDWFFDEWLQTTKVCDYAIKSVKFKKGKVYVKVVRNNDIIMPIDVLLKTQDGKKFIKRWNGKARSGTLVFETRSKPRYVEIDPENHVLEINKWNNTVPMSKIKIHPMPGFGFPSFESYQLFWFPHIGKNSIDGLRLGMGGALMQFPDMGPMKGKHNLKGGVSYGLKSKKLNYSLDYDTPIYFTKNRLRLNTVVSQNWDEFQSKFGLNCRFGKYISRPPEHHLSWSIGLRKIDTVEYCSTRDFDPGKTIFSQVTYLYKIRHRNLRVTYAIGYETAKKVLYGENDFDKIWLDLTNRIVFTRGRWVRLRFFGGYIVGEPLQQDEFFLYGRLRPTGINEIIASPKSNLSTQEHLHESGDGNLRGEIGQHLHDKVILAANLETKLPMTPFNLFFDIGNVCPTMDSLTRDLKMDAGLMAEFGPIRVEFPIWISNPIDEKELKFRWLIEIQAIKIGF